MPEPAKHARTQIRELLKTALTGLPSTADRVFTGVRYPVSGTALPCICIYTEPEESSSEGGADTLQRVTPFHLDWITNEGGEELQDDELDALALEGEVAISADTTLGGKVIHVGLTGTEPFRPNEGDPLFGGIRLIVEVMYQTLAGSPGEFQ